MLRLPLNAGGQLRRILCIGAHCDDIEIGCGATLLSLLADQPALEVAWVVLSSDPVREAEACRSAAAFLPGGGAVEIQKFRNGYFPAEWPAIKDFLEGLKRRIKPDLILCHHRGDFHQDHRIVGELAWNTWRDQLILEYEIPKYDGDLGRPNVYVPVSAEVMRRKVDLILRHFPSQQDKHWWSAATFESLMRLRGVECNAPGGYAEAFHGPKVVLATAGSAP